MDWILISNLVDYIATPILVLSICILGVLGVSVFLAAIDEEIDNWLEGVRKSYSLIFKLFIGAILLGCITIAASVPDILIKTNVDKIKLRYTDMESVKKLDGAAEKIIDKLDKLIDKGIDSLGDDNE